MRTSLFWGVLACASIACGDKKTGGTVDAPPMMMIDAAGNGMVDAMVMPIDCSSGTCQCMTGQACDVQCPTGNCNVTCQDMSTCTVSCAGGGCNIDCKDAAGCTIECAGGGCTINGDPGASISVNCGGNGACDTTCDAAPSCTQTCTSNCQLDCGGSTTCTQTCSGAGCQCTGCP